VSTAQDQPTIAKNTHTKKLFCTGILHYSSYNNFWRKWSNGCRNMCFTYAFIV